MGDPAALIPELYGPLAACCKGIHTPCCAADILPRALLPKPSNGDREVYGEGMCEEGAMWFIAMY